MTEDQHRYIGVARPGQGVDPHPPRQVVDVATVAAVHAAAATAPPPSLALTGPTVQLARPAPPGSAATGGTALNGPTVQVSQVGRPAPSPPFVPRPLERGRPPGPQRQPGSPGPAPTQGVYPEHPGPAPTGGEGSGAITIGRAKVGRPNRYGRFAGHRKRFRRAVFRRWELGVWILAAALAVGMVTVLVRGSSGPVALAGPSISTADPVPASPTPGPISNNGQCVFDPCKTVQYTGVPTRVRIPAIKVDSPLESLVLNAKGELNPPVNFAQAGWWTGGVPPGDIGPAIIAGHVDNYLGPAVFYKLRDLKAGDQVQVDRGSQTVTFTVTNVEQYPKDAFPTNKVYSPTPAAELRLITCGGSFDASKRSYRDNIVVYAILTP